MQYHILEIHATLPKTNIAPENGWFEYILVSFWDGLFSGVNSQLFIGECISYTMKLSCERFIRWQSMQPFPVRALLASSSRLGCVLGKKSIKFIKSRVGDG